MSQFGRTETGREGLGGPALGGSQRRGRTLTLREAAVRHLGRRPRCFSGATHGFPTREYPLSESRYIPRYPDPCAGGTPRGRVISSPVGRPALRLGGST